MVVPSFLARTRDRCTRLRLECFVGVVGGLKGRSDLESVVACVVDETWDQVVPSLVDARREDFPPGSSLST